MAVPLGKRIEAVKIILAKKQLPNVKAQVGVGFDISGSTQHLYGNGTVQDVAERILAIACRFDDNQTLDAWSFDSRCTELESITMQNYATFVEKEILNNSSVSKWGGTVYASMMGAAVKKFFAEKTITTVTKKLFGLFTSKQDTVVPASDSVLPVYIIVITDGENNDKQQTIERIEENSNRNIYWQFVGIGRESFEFLRKLSNKYDNVGFVAVTDIASISDDDLYMQLLNDEFCNWIKK